MPPYYVEYFCPRISPTWQREMFSWADFPGAVAEANRLMWQYHSARVLDRFGVVRYSV